MSGGFHAAGDTCCGFHLGGQCTTSAPVGGSSDITLGTTQIVGGVDRLVLFQSGTTITEGTGLKFNTDAQLVLSQGTPAAAKPMLALTDVGTGLTRLAADILSICTAGVERWQVTAAGHLLAATDNTFDIGADGATRPRNIRAAGAVLAGNGAVGTPAFGFDSDESSGLYRIGAGQIGWALAGALAMSLGVVGPDSDQTFVVGRAQIDSRTTDQVHFSHRDMTTTAQSMILQTALGQTGINSASGLSLQLKTAGTTRWQVGATSFEFSPGTDGNRDIGATALRIQNFFQAGYSELTQFASGADPAAAPSGKARLYARDNGAGKGQLCVRFPTGAVQVLATEP